MPLMTCPQCQAAIPIGPLAATCRCGFDSSKAGVLGVPSVRLTEAQRTFLRFAATAPDKGWDGVFPRRGQHAMAALLVARGLLAHAGTGVDLDDLDRQERDLFAITDAGRAALALTLDEVKAALAKGAEARQAAERLLKRSPQR